MNPEKPVKKGYPECDQEARDRLPLPPYGEDPGDDCYGLPIERSKSEIRYSGEDGAILSSNKNGSTVYRQLTGDSRPIEDHYELEQTS